MAEKLTPGTTTQNGLVAESDLMYEAPSTAPTFDLKAAEEKFLQSLLAGDVPEDPSAYDQFEAGAESGAGDEDPSYIEEEAAAEDPKPAFEEPGDEPEAEDEDEPVVEDPKLARGIQRVVQRELAAKAEREAADRAIAEMKALKAELEQYRDLKSTKEIADLMDIDTVGALKAMGKDPDTIIKLALAQQLGDNAPAALKEFAREANTKREIAALRNQLAAQEQEKRAAAYFNTVQTGAREYVNTLGDRTPTLASVAKADPDYVRDEIMEEIVAEARKQAATNPDGEPISYEEAAKRVEARLSRVAKLLKVQNSTNTAPKIASKPGRTPPTTKPAAKPIVPWARRNDSIEEQGLAEAMRIFEMEEAKRKAYRR